MRRMQPLGAVGKTEGCRQIKRHRREYRQNNAHRTEGKADAAEDNKDEFFDCHFFSDSMLKFSSFFRFRRCRKRRRYAL